MKNNNVTIFGDSISKGMAIKNGRPTKLATNAVDIIAKNYNIEINNISYFGQTLNKIYERKMIDSYLENINKKAKNIVVFAVGGNDADFDWKTIQNNPNENYSPKTDATLFETMLTELIKKLKKNKIEVWVTGLPPINSENYFKNVISKTAKADAIMNFYKGDITNIERHQELYNMILFKVAVKTDCYFLDIRSPLLKERDNLSIYSEDGVHPNEKGQEKIANFIINIVNGIKKCKKKDVNLKICV